MLNCETTQQPSNEQTGQPRSICPVHLKVTYFAKRVYHVFMKMPSKSFTIFRAQLEKRFFDELSEHREELRVYWIDQDGDQIEMINQTDYDIFNAVCFLNPHLYVSPISFVTTTRNSKFLLTALPANGLVELPESKSEMLKSNHQAHSTILRCRPSNMLMTALTNANQGQNLSGASIEKSKHRESKTPQFESKLAKEERSMCENKTKLLLSKSIFDQMTMASAHNNELCEKQTNNTEYPTFDQSCTESYTSNSYSNGANSTNNPTKRNSRLNGNSSCDYDTTAEYQNYDSHISTTVTRQPQIYNPTTYEPCTIDIVANLLKRSKNISCDGATKLAKQAALVTSSYRDDRDNRPTVDSKLTPKCKAEQVDANCKRFVDASSRPVIRVQQCAQPNDLTKICYNEYIYYDYADNSYHRYTPIMPDYASLSNDFEEQSNSNVYTDNNFKQIIEQTSNLNKLLQQQQQQQHEDDRDLKKQSEKQHKKCKGSENVALPTTSKRHRERICSGFDSGYNDTNSRTRKSCRCTNANFKSSLKSDANSTTRAKIQTTFKTTDRTANVDRPERSSKKCHRSNVDSEKELRCIDLQVSNVKSDPIAVSKKTRNTKNHISSQEACEKTESKSMHQDVSEFSKIIRAFEESVTKILMSDSNNNGCNQELSQCSEKCKDRMKSRSREPTPENSTSMQVHIDKLKHNLTKFLESRHSSNGSNGNNIKICKSDCKLTHLSTKSKDDFSDATEKVETPTRSSLEPKHSAQESQDSLVSSKHEHRKLTQEESWQVIMAPKQKTSTERGSMESKVDQRNQETAQSTRVERKQLTENLKEQQLSSVQMQKRQEKNQMSNGEFIQEQRIVSQRESQCSQVPKQNSEQLLRKQRTSYLQETQLDPLLESDHNFKRKSFQDQREQDVLLDEQQSFQDQQTIVQRYSPPDSLSFRNQNTEFSQAKQTCCSPQQESKQSLRKQRTTSLEETQRDPILEGDRNVRRKSVQDQKANDVKLDEQQSLQNQRAILQRKLETKRESKQPLPNQTTSSKLFQEQSSNREPELRQYSRNRKTSETEISLIEISPIQKEPLYTEALEREELQRYEDQIDNCKCMKHCRCSNRSRQDEHSKGNEIIINQVYLEEEEEQNRRQIEQNKCPQSVRSLSDKLPSQRNLNDSEGQETFLRKTKVEPKEERESFSKQNSERECFVRQYKDNIQARCNFRTDQGNQCLRQQQLRDEGSLHERNVLLCRRHEGQSLQEQAQQKEMVSHSVEPPFMRNSDRSQDNLPSHEQLFPRNQGKDSFVRQNQTRDSFFRQTPEIKSLINQSPEIRSFIRQDPEIRSVSRDDSQAKSLNRLELERAGESLHQQHLRNERLSQSRDSVRNRQQDLPKEQTSTSQLVPAIHENIDHAEKRRERTSKSILTQTYWSQINVSSQTSGHQFASVNAFTDSKEYARNLDSLPQQSQNLCNTERQTYPNYEALDCVEQWPSPDSFSCSLPCSCCVKSSDDIAKRKTIPDCIVTCLDICNMESECPTFTDMERKNTKLRRCKGKLKRERKDKSIARDHSYKRKTSTNNNEEWRNENGIANTHKIPNKTSELKKSKHIVVDIHNSAVDIYVPKKISGPRISNAHHATEQTCLINDKMTNSLSNGAEYKTSRLKIKNSFKTTRQNSIEDTLTVSSISNLINPHNLPVHDRREQTCQMLRNHILELRNGQEIQLKTEKNCSNIMNSKQTDPAIFYVQSPKLKSSKASTPTALKSTTDSQRIVSQLSLMDERRALNART